MSEWALKRFWKTVAVEEGDEGFSVRLDARPVRTPSKRLLALPTRTMAERVAAEWEAQAGAVDPVSMPWTRSANSAIDKVSPQRDEVEAHLIGYAGTDLLSYRAEGPEELAARQSQAWDPVLDWVAQRFDVRLVVTRGVMPVVQSSDGLQRLRGAMGGMSDFRLTGFHDLVTLSGSYALALAAAEALADPDEVWRLSRIDEDWQIEQWGEDEEAAEHARIRRDAFLHAAAFYRAA